MEIRIEVCDICGKKHGIMIKKEGIVFGDRSCFLDYCNGLWLKWEDEKFQNRGVVHKKAISPQLEQQMVDSSAILFKPRAVK
ncbi:MAG: hypothetical protein C5B54_02105 [Acidobacteria bacterium]|nr:MAG: hypothetical protein C5B54_02105 [Acidobacteriota bacterium]